MRKTLSFMAASVALQGMSAHAETPLVQCIKSQGENNDWGYELVVEGTKKLTFRILKNIPEVASDVVATDENGIHYLDFGGDGQVEETATTDGPAEAVNDNYQDIYGEGVIQLYEECYEDTLKVIG